jgi:hypothetical protein
MWVLLLSPFVTATLTFAVITHGIVSDEMTQNVAWIYFQGFLFATWMIVGFSICSGIFILVPAVERESRLRYLMNFAGMQTFAYYLGNFLSDLVLFLIPTCAFIGLLFPLKIFVFIAYWDTVLCIMMSFGVSIIGLTYLIGFAFDRSDTAFRQVGTFYIVLGFIVSGIVQLIAGAIKGNDFRKWFMINPFLPFFESMIYVVFAYLFDLPEL